MRNVVLRLMGASTCWQCGAESDTALFCPQCQALQPPPAEYFQFFGLPRTLALDAAELQRRFYALSRQLHPDRYTRKSSEEQDYSLEATAILNDGFRVLRDPVQRAEYVLKQEGFDIGEQRTKDVPAELLEEVFELNMALEELRTGDESVRPQLEAAREHFAGMKAEIDGGLSGLFERYDGAQDRAVLQQIRSVLNRRRYIRNLINEVEKELNVHVSN